MNAEGHVQGTVVEMHGVKATVLTHENPHRVRCRPPKDRTPPAVGDRVWISDAGSESRIEVLETRERCLWRPKEQGKQLMASHVDRVVLVVAPAPKIKLMMVDRVLVATESAEIDLMIVLNKCDQPDFPKVVEALKPYVDLGYVTHPLSALTGEGVEAFRASLGKGLSVVIGQSGVGKSTLLNAMCPGANLKSGALSHATGKGRHVTSVSTCHLVGDPWPDGGMVVDTPGVRTFGLYRTPLGDLSMGFRELLDLRVHCKFRDCLHDMEPGCAVREAVEEGRVTEGRYARYLTILDSVRAEEG